MPSRTSTAALAAAARAMEAMAQFAALYPGRYVELLSLGRA